MQINPTLSHNLVSQLKETTFSGSVHCLYNTQTRKYVCLCAYTHPVPNTHTLLKHRIHPCLCFILAQSILGSQIHMLSIWENGLKLFGNGLAELLVFHSSFIYLFILFFIYLLGRNWESCSWVGPPASLSQNR